LIANLEKANAPVPKELIARFEAYLKQEDLKTAIKMSVKMLNELRNTWEKLENNRRVQI